MDDAFLYLVVTISTVLGGLAYSEWRIRRFRAHFATTALQTLQDAFFDEDEVESKDGVKRVLLRPNARLQGFLGSAVPGLLDWAVKHVHVKLPPFELPEGMDLKAVGMNVLAQKAMSGKKLKLDDAIPLVLGYAKDYAEKSGILDTLGKTVGGTAKKTKELASHWTEAKK